MTWRCGTEGHGPSRSSAEHRSSPPWTAPERAVGRRGRDSNHVSEQGFNSKTMLTGYAWRAYSITAQRICLPARHELRPEQMRDEESARGRRGSWDVVAPDAECGCGVRMRMQVRREGGCRKTAQHGAARGSRSTTPAPRSGSAVQTPIGRDPQHHARAGHGHRDLHGAASVPGVARRPRRGGERCTRRPRYRHRHGQRVEPQDQAVPVRRDAICAGIPEMGKNQ